MGTRADFWLGHGPEAEWLGSVAWDGCEFDDPASPVMTATTEDDFRGAVKAHVETREDFTAPRVGWPWPWKTSGTTDYAYVFDRGAVHVYVFGAPRETGSDAGRVQREDWRDMSDVQNIAFGSKKSGIFIVST